ncbi:hypothetical protein OQY15_21505 [Pedobacter sp. MC2016-15]|jgi:uncharacterized membrane protein (DUF485 family)|uniref:hypothetical protein n=1 Tax=Pedobacter sp. MC2016-15 TaxID=2994473 RepID=UPI00224667B4|nr:hypothetical protein [Pedobacter sp. MC2016-15]MCX2481689.1 hypothetical protein [Pedobacter sp. MC2016-15]
MIDFNTFKQKSPQQRFLFILGLVMFAMYLALGIYLIFWKDIPFDIEPTYRILFGVLLIVYAGIRFFRLINQKDN